MFFYFSISLLVENFALSSCLRLMKKNGEISYESTSPLITYENYKDKKRLEYAVNR
jgi:hypothetical protein